MADAPLPTSRASLFRAIRHKMGTRYVKARLVREEVTVVADDCWAGRLYSALGLKCRSPFIGMGFESHEYIDFLLKMREPDALDVLSVSSKERGYPIIQTRHARLFGMHYSSEQEVVSRYERRCRLIAWDQLFIKIDFGRSKYRPEDIERWNALRLPRAVALYPDEPRYRAMKIHRGVAVAGWEMDGSRQFILSTRHFDVFDWLNEDRVHAPRFYHRTLHLLLMDWYLVESWRALFRRTRASS